MLVKTILCCPRSICVGLRSEIDTQVMGWELNLFENQALIHQTNLKTDFEILPI